MNDEIKEILDFKENADYKKLSCDEIKVLRDYITNLQQYSLSLAKENEQEKQFIKDCGFENAQQLVLDYIEIRQEKEDYKSRIEKAVEYINKYKEPLYRNFDEPDCDYWIATNPQDIIDILNGRSDE